MAKNSKYEVLDEEWGDLTNLHGMGKSAIARLKVVMRGKKITFRN